MLHNITTLFQDGGNLYLASNDDPNNLKNIQVVRGGNTYF